MKMRCAACDHPDREAIDHALASGTPGRAVARQYGIGRGVVARHRDHMEATPAAAGRDQFAEAVKLLGRAATTRERLRGMESLRAALRLELRDFTKARIAMRTPDCEQLRQLKESVEQAWAMYETVAGGSVDASIRALQGVRESVAALREATARLPDDDDLVEVPFADHNGNVFTTWRVSRRQWHDFYGIPQRYRTGSFHVAIQLSYAGASPGVRVTDDQGEVVWERPAQPLGSEIVVRPFEASESAPPNGHGA